MPGNLNAPREPMDCHECGDALPLVRHYKTYLCDACKADFGRRAGASAHKIVAMAVRFGFLRPVTDCRCVDCGIPATEYDHRDYNKPLDVDPVCRSCNFKRGPAKPFRRLASAEPKTEQAVA